MGYARAITLLWLGCLTWLAQPLTPSELAWPNRAPIPEGLSFWLKADVGVYADFGLTLATNGQQVAQWNDDGGDDINVSQESVTNRPTFIANVLNGKPVVRFDQLDTVDDVYRFLTNYSEASTLPMTYSAVVKFDSSNTNNGYFVSSFTLLSPNANVPRIGMLDTNGLFKGMIMSRDVGGTEAIDYVLGDTITFNQFHIITYVLSASGCRIRIDGVESSVTGTFYNHTDAGILVGSATTLFLPGQSFDGDVAEITKFRRALNTQEILAVEGYLRKKWGL